MYGTHREDRDFGVFHAVGGDEPPGGAAELLGELLSDPLDHGDRVHHAAVREVAHFGEGFGAHHRADRIGLRGIENLTRFIGRKERVDFFLRRDVHALEGVRQHEPVHADHDRNRDFFGDAEGLDVQVHRFLVRFAEELDPAAVALAHRVGMVVPDVDRGADRAVGDRHDDGQPQPRAVVDRLHHVEEPLGRGRRVGARTRDRGADRDRHRGEFALDVDVLAVLELALAAEQPQVFDDVRLRGNRIGADHFRAAERHGLGDALAAFELLKHAHLPARASPPRRPSRRLRRWRPQRRP